MISTIDGAATGSSGKTGDLGGDADREFFALMRSMADVILVGANTARVEGYRPDAPVPIAVLSRSGRIPPDLADHALAFSSITDALAEFAARGWNRVVAEGGPHVLGQLVEADLLDEICLTIAPVMAAGDAPRIAPGGQPVDREFTLADLTTVDGVVFGRWVRDRG